MSDKMSDITRHDLMDNYNYFYNQIDSEKPAAILAVGASLVDKLAKPATSLREIVAKLDAIRLNTIH